MMSPDMVKYQYQDAPLKEIIKERDRLIRQIRKYEKGKIPEDEYCMDPSPDVVYMMNNLYLAELCYLISEKTKSMDDLNDLEICSERS